MQKLNSLLYIFFSVTAEVRRSEFYNTQKGEDIDAVAALCRILLCQGIPTCHI